MENPSAFPGERAVPLPDDLSAADRTVLQLLALLNEPVSAAVLLGCLHRAAERDASGLDYSQHTLLPCVERLRAAGLVDEQLQPAAGLVDPLLRQAAAGKNFRRLVRAVQAELPFGTHYAKRQQKCVRALREFRISLYLHDAEQLSNMAALLAAQCGDILEGGSPFFEVCTNPFDAEWFATLPLSLQFYLLEKILAHSLRTLDHRPGLISSLEDGGVLSRLSEEERLPFYRLLANYKLWRGQCEDVHRILGRNQTFFAASGLEGCLAFLLGNNDEALRLFAADLHRLQELTGNANIYFYSVSGLFYVVALLKAGRREHIDTMRHCIEQARQQQPEAMLHDIYTLLEGVLLAQENKVLEAEAVFGRVTQRDHAVVRLFEALARFWLDSDLARETVDDMAQLCERAQEQGFDWLALECAEMLAQVEKSSLWAEQVEAIRRRTELDPVASAVRLKESWERRLTALIHAASAVNRQEMADRRRNSRLVWMVDYRNNELSLLPREQKRTVKGGWSKGRPVALSRLYSGARLDFLTTHDLRLCEAIRRQQSGPGMSYYFDMERALPALVGHPHLFWEKSPSVPVEFVKGEPELLVEETAGGALHLKFARELVGDGFAVVRETTTRFKLVKVTEEHRRIARIIGRKGLVVPKNASTQVMRAVSDISSFMTVHSAVAADSSLFKSSDIETVVAEPRIHVQLLPYGKGMKLEMFVLPFAVGGPYLKPGIGVENVMAEVHGRRMQTRRDLALEDARAKEVEERCPTLALHEEINREWRLLEVDECLQVLLELQDLRDEVVLEWPEGEKFAVRAQVGSERFAVRVQQRHNWFGVSGELKVDQELVLDMRRLLELGKKNSGRFIPLGDGQFLALTDEFRRRLDEMLFFAELSENDGNDDGEVRIHPLASLAFAEFIDKLPGADTDEAWRRQLEKIEATRELAPELPSTLQAELRDYQVDGYAWLARLAAWGVGACLADDMGLGKTLQALAIVLARATEGPTLVVAPTSVCSNWQSEAARFAPTLSLHFFGPRERRELVAGLGPFDVLVTSYTLLQQEIELLGGVKWQTIVLDEAQAIKNMATKRSQAAMALTGGFKLITTGTPIENHLGELWNLFNFVAPGLLGTWEWFNERYASPIERQQSREARRKLKRLIQPFILRRIKSQVLEELPPRTEVVLQVEMGEEERAFYEALRRQALERLEHSSLPPGQRHMQILAEIMRLRRACCNPKLVVPDSVIPSSKLRLFGRVVEELIESRHKVLVFSQFVGHLALIRRYLDSRSIVYCYLDGSTPARERKRQVDLFQSGHGDLFLISLKAGGQGLNLTAADYVLHMDPWWNPAVEDQASDRAHRIGQKHPVTIYRLVATNTIEEKIVALHQEKRDLANSLLEGSDVSARMSAGELLDLIRVQ